MHDDVCVAADGRGEVRVDGAGQAVVREQRLLDAARGEVHCLQFRVWSVPISEGLPFHSFGYFYEPNESIPFEES